MEVSGQLHALATLPPETPPYQVDMKFGGPQSWYGHEGGEKLPAPAGN